MEFFDNIVLVVLLCLTAALAARLAALAVLAALTVRLTLATRHLGQTRKRCGFARGIHCSIMVSGFLFCLERFRHPQLFTLYVRWPLSGTHLIFLWNSGQTMLAVGFSVSIAAFGPIRRDPAPPTSTTDSNNPPRIFCGFVLRPLNSPIIICSSPVFDPMSLFALSMIAPIQKPLFSPFRTVTIRRRS